LLPVRLSPIYELSVTFSPWDVVYVFSALVALAITVLLLTYRKRFAGALAVWISYLALVAPVSGLAQTGYQIAADRYTYLPCMGFAILAGGMALGWALREHDGRRERAVLGLTLLSSVTLGCLTWRQCKVWRDSQTLWQHAVSLDPTSSRAHNNLGWAMAESARLGTARTHLSKAIQLRPGFADGHINLGVVLRRLRDPIGAMEQYRHAAATGARSADVAYNMAVLLAEEPLLIGLGYETAEDQLRAAADNYERCLALRPDHIRALYGLGIVYKRLGQLDRAKALYYRALRLEPTNVNARYNLAITLAADGDLAGADQQYRQVLSLNPHHVGACNNLANLLAQRGRSVEAVRLLSWGLVQSPGNVNLTYQLSWLLAAAPDANARDGPKAIALASQLPRRPHGEVPEHLDVLAAGYAESGRFDEAVVTASRALEAATKMQNTSLARAIAGRVELYRMRQPYRTSSSEP
jgi:Flp pilus assembly protein TadD